MVSEYATMLYKTRYPDEAFDTDITRHVIAASVRYTTRATNIGHMYASFRLHGI